MISPPRVRVWGKGVKGCEGGMKCSETGMNDIADRSALSSHVKLLLCVKKCNQIRPWRRFSCKMVKFCQD